METPWIGIMMFLLYLVTSSIWSWWLAEQLLNLMVKMGRDEERDGK